ncbi:MAG: tail fiber protein [Chitinophagaceae bacterium]
MYSQSYIGLIGIFAGNFAPVGWLMCDGSLLAISEYDVLFNLIGTTYGGDGQTTFALPDLRGRVAIHQGQGPGLSPYVIGQRAGTESITFITNQIPVHSHAFVGIAGNPGASANAGTTDTPTGAVPAMISGSTFYNSGNTGTTLGTSSLTVNTPPAGGSQPVEIMSPFLTMNYVICVAGIYPTQN